MLLYHADKGWQHRSIEQVVARIRSLVPQGLQNGWTLLNRGEARRRASECADAAAWIVHRGP
eukprot:11111467-Lingulodinium_polyedra.AAC.1